MQEIFFDFNKKEKSDAICVAFFILFSCRKEKQLLPKTKHQTSIGLCKLFDHRCDRVHPYNLTMLKQPKQELQSLILFSFLYPFIWFNNKKTTPNFFNLSNTIVCFLITSSKIMNLYFLKSLFPYVDAQPYTVFSTNLSHDADYESCAF